MRVDWKPASLLLIRRCFRTKKPIEFSVGSEEEYRELLRFAQLHSRPRPAEYDHIPEVNNVSATVIAVASLVLGLATTAVSLLLRPETPEIEQAEERRIGQQNLSNQIGPKPFQPNQQLRRLRVSG